MEMCRREFVKGVAAASVVLGRAACPHAAVAQQPPQPSFAWSFLVHFGMNMWGDIVSKPSRDGLIKRRLTDEEFALVCGDDYLALDRVRFDENLWRDLSEQLRRDGCNQIVVDVGEFLKYPSHPELAVKGSWSVEKLRAEIARLRGMGFEVIPKMNFGSGRASARANPGVAPKAAAPAAVLMKSRLLNDMSCFLSFSFPFDARRAGA